jgi:hypothetical protein
MRYATRNCPKTAPPDFESTNYTNYTALLQRHISVDIVVWRAGGDLDKAEVQCAVWIAAEFSRIETLVASVREAQSLELLEVKLRLHNPAPPQKRGRRLRYRRIYRTVSATCR